MLALHQKGKQNIMKIKIKKNGKGKRKLKFLGI